jgi:hypothetical protein
MLRYNNNNNSIVWMALVVVMVRILEKNAGVQDVLAISFVRRHAAGASLPATAALQVPSTCLDDGTTETDSQSSSPGGSFDTLVLDGSCRIVSEPMPCDVTQRELVTFLQRSGVRDLFFSAGGTRPVTAYQITPDVETMWRNVVQCKYFTCPPPLSTSKSSSSSSLLPKPGDETLMSFDSVVHMFGLTITTTALNGIKTFRPHHHHHSHHGDNESPIYYMAVGVAERQTVVGPRPMVWLYQQVTGLHKKKAGVFYPTPARACSKISITHTACITDSSNGSHDDDDNDNQSSPRLWALEYNVHLKIIMHVPHVLVRLLPASKTSLERQASAAIVQGLSKDIEATLGRVRQAFLQQRQQSKR